MILKRLHRNLTNQDWVAILVELFIVVLGILLALQADDWNERRLERRAERETLEQLLDETRHAIDYYQILIDRMAWWSSATEAVIVALEARDLSTLDDDALVLGILAADMNPTLTPPRSVIDALTRAGRTERVTDPVMRFAIDEYAQELHFAEQAIENIRRGHESVEVAAGSGLVARHDPEKEYRVSLRPDRSKLLARPDLLPVLFRAFFEQQEIRLNHRADLLEVAVSLCESLARHLGESDCLLKPAAG